MWEVDASCRRRRDAARGIARHPHGGSALLTGCAEQGLNARFGRRMRAEKRHQPPPENGLMMNMCAVAGLASSGTRFDDRLDLAQRVGQRRTGCRRSARRRRPPRTRATARSPSGSASRRSAPGSSSPAARSGCCRRRDRRGRPPNIPAYIAIRATIMIAAAIVAATELIRMSRCLTCASSCAMTPSSSCCAQHLHDPLGRRNGRVLRVASGRERVRRRIRNDVDLRHRQAGLLRQPLASSGRADAPARPPARDTCAGRSCPRTSTNRGSSPRRSTNAIIRPCCAAGQVADQQQQAAQRAEQQRRLQSVCHDVILPLLGAGNPIASI